jgi:uncharacterized Zn finger protein (UPF0148 family)
MQLRIRCPQCHTVLRVKAGTRPTCPACGFAGAGPPDPDADRPVEFTSSPEPVRFTRAEAAHDAGGQAQAATGEPGGWQPVPEEEAGAAEGEAWEDTGGGWRSRPPEEPQRKRFRLFSGRR